MVSIRPYEAQDRQSCLDLWLEAWAAAMPEIDFHARLDWWRQRWDETLAGVVHISVAHTGQTLCGFVTIDLSTAYLDQLVVAPVWWGKGVGEALLEAACAACPHPVTLQVNQDNIRALSFYRKHRFVEVGEGVNPLSGRAVLIMKRTC